MNYEEMWNKLTDCIIERIESLDTKPPTTDEERTHIKNIQRTFNMGAKHELVTLEIIMRNLEKANGEIDNE